MKKKEQNFPFSCSPVSAAVKIVSDCTTRMFSYSLAGLTCPFSNGGNDNGDGARRNGHDADTYQGRVDLLPATLDVGLFDLNLPDIPFTGLYSGPYFDGIPRNVSAQLGARVELPCRVKQAGGKSVSATKQPSTSCSVPKSEVPRTVSRWHEAVIRWHI